jgi:tRNA threonylcarbamoyladenosine biosynthesis protein TsaB
MIILHIETSTKVCSVALSENNQCIFYRYESGEMNHAALLHPFIQEALDELKVRNQKPDAVAVSSGPGSYTGLRIGVSAAKGLCYGFRIPLISLNTLTVMAVEMIKKTGENPEAFYIPMIDARRMEVYDLVLDSSLKVLRETTADIIDENSFTLFSDKQVYIAGNGSDKCRDILPLNESCFLTDIHPLAINMIDLAVKKYEMKDFEDVAYFEPYYLKEFHTGSK